MTGAAGQEEPVPPSDEVEVPGSAKPTERTEPAEQAERAEQAAPTEPTSAAERSTGTGGLPEQTKDDTDVGWERDPQSMDAHDRWLLEQRPPHWD